MQPSRGASLFVVCGLCLSACGGSQAAPDLATPLDATLVFDPLDAAVAVDAAADTDGSILPDALVVKDAGPDLADPFAGLPLTHPLASADDLRQIFNLHQLGARQFRQVMEAAYSLAPAPMTCPSGRVETVPEIDETFTGGCTQPGALTFGGNYTSHWPNWCKHFPSLHADFTAEGFSLVGTDPTGGVDDLFMDLVYSQDYLPSYEIGQSTWSGKAAWKKLGWSPMHIEILDGITVTGKQVSRAGTIMNGVKFGGWMDIEGKGSVLITTPQDLFWLEEPACFVGTKGQLRFQGAHDVVVTFDTRGTCQDPTWTRDGVPMGSVHFDMYGEFTLCVGP